MAGLTDAQMAVMEAPSQAAPKRGLTDQEMAAHEAPQGFMDKLRVDSQNAPDPMQAYKAVHGDDSTGQKALSILFGNKDNPTVEGTAPMVAPAGALPSVLARTGAALTSSAPRRVGTGAVQGAITGAVHDPDNAGPAALKGGFWGGATALAGEAVPAVAKFFAGKGAAMSPEQVQTYKDNPAMVNDTYDSFKNDPQGFNENLRQYLSKAVRGPDSLFEKVSKPLMAERAAVQEGKSAGLNPDELQGVAKDIVSKYKGNGENLPESTPLSVLQDAKKAAQDSAAASGAYDNRPNPLGKPGMSPDKADAAKLDELINGVAPETADINQKLALNTRQAKFAQKSLGLNPSRILSSGDSIGSTPLRALRQTLDEGAGTNLNELAQALDSGRALNAPNKVHGFLGRMSDAAGQQAVRALGSDAGQGILGSGGSQSTNPVLRQLLLDGLTDKK